MMGMKRFESNRMELLCGFIQYCIYCLFSSAKSFGIQQISNDDFFELKAANVEHKTADVELEAVSVELKATNGELKAADVELKTANVS